MSADNGCYLMQFKDGWRVIYAQAIENLYWWNIEGYQQESRSELNPFIVKKYFEESLIYKTREEAEKRAFELAKEVRFLEYGICQITGFEDKEFPYYAKCCNKPSIISKFGDLIDGSIEQCMNCGEYI